MKRLFLIFTLTMFFANIFVVATWAKPCVSSASASMTTSMTSSDDMSCHDENQKNNQDQCDGLCLCLHASTNQTFMANNVNIDIIPIIKSFSWAFLNEHITSRHPSPPHRPPNTYC